VNIGPRVWKTGVAVVIALLISQELNLSSHYLAVIAAMVSMKSSVSQSLLHAGHRSAGTVIGGAIGILMLFFWEANPVTVGLAIILAIMICVQLKLEEAIILTGISVAAVMLGVEEGSHLIYAGERLLVTLIGLASGTAINLAFSPPKRETLLREELNRLNGMLRNFYMYVSQKFLASSAYNEEEVEEKTEAIRCQFEEVRRIFFELKEEIGYLSSFEKISIYEKIISTFYLIFDSILGIYQTAHNRYQREINLSRITPHYQDILDKCQQLLTVSLGFQTTLGDTECSEQDMDNYASSYTCQGENIITHLRNTVNDWHFTDENRENSISLMELSTICYEKEQIFRFTLKLQELFKKLNHLEEQQYVNKKEKLLLFKWIKRPKG